MAAAELSASGDLVGRTRELQQLLGGVEDACAGRGSLWFLCGEPGIGKSRLAEEAARLAAEREVCTLWGRCWEAGGAPPYWPWVQILRALPRAVSQDVVRGLSPAHAAQLAQLVPELSSDTGRPPAPLPALPPDQARFQLLDAAGALLCEAARARPLLLVLEDLHAADSASVRMLDFVAGATRGSALTLVGTYRDAEAARSPVGPLLARLSGLARTLALRRLSRHEVATFLGHELPDASDDTTVDALFETTEGNPLFVVETARLLSMRGGQAAFVAGAAGQVGLAVPPSVRHTILERLRALPAEVVELLELAAVVGREFERDTLAATQGRAAAELAAPLAEAVDAAVLLEISPGVYRFSHILVREALHQRIPEARRGALHLALAGALERDRASWTEVAHHYLEAGEQGLRQAAQSAARAADEAMHAFAFREAELLYRRALSALDDAAAERRGEVTEAERIELLLGVARAQLRGGDLERGFRTCIEASRLARRAQDPELLARAALTYGSVFVFAAVDETLVGLLREALERLPARDSALRAELLSRLAAATQPSRKPEEPIQLAREAIAMARRLGDERGLLSALRAGGSAMADLAHPGERLPLDREHVALARKLGDRVEELRGLSRQLFDCYALGELPAAHAALDAAVGISRELDHPAFLWRAEAFVAMRCAWEGRFDEAEEHARRARELSRRAGDPNAARSLSLQRINHLNLQGRFDELPQALTELDGVEPLSAIGRSISMTIRHAALAQAGRITADEVAPARALEDGLALGDPTLLECTAALCSLRRDRNLAARLIARLDPWADHYVQGGQLCLSWDGPASRPLGRLHALCGDWELAQQRFEQALVAARRLGSPPQLAWLLHDFTSALLCERDPGRARAMLAEAAEICRRHGMPGVLERVEAQLAVLAPAARPPAAGASPPAVPRVEALRILENGESWWVEAAGQRFALRDTKGVRMLAQLVAEPGREFHVLELSAPGGAVDTGDAGAALDAEARAAYRERARTLREELEEASAHNDLARAERAREELDFLAGELTRSVGLGARERKVGSASERARINVQRRLKDAIRRIESHSPELGKHLEWAVRTGTFCCYDPR